MLIIQHHLNPLHVYCRFVKGGLNRKLSRFICIGYEVLVYRMIASSTETVLKICRFYDNFSKTAWSHKGMIGMKDIIAALAIAFIMTGIMGALFYALFSYIA